MKSERSVWAGVLDVLGSPSLTVHTVPVDVKQHSNKRVVFHWRLRGTTRRSSNMKETNVAHCHVALSCREPSVLPQQVPGGIWAGIRPQWTWEAARTPGCGWIGRPRFNAASASGWRWHTNLVNGHQCGPTLLGGRWDGVFWICWLVVQSIVFPGCCFDDGIWISGWCPLMLESCLLCGCGRSSAFCSLLRNKLTLIFASHQCCILLQKEVCWCCRFSVQKPGCFELCQVQYVHCTK